MLIASNSLPFEEIQKCLPMAVFGFGRCRAASLFLDQDFGLKKGADIVGALVGHTHFHGLSTFIACRRIKIQAVSAGMQVRAAVPAALGDLDLIRNLNFRRAIVAARDQVKSGLNAPSRSLGSRRRFGLSIAIVILIAGLTVLSAHFPP